MTESRVESTASINRRYQLRGDQEEEVPIRMTGEKEETVLVMHS